MHVVCSVSHPLPNYRYLYMYPNLYAYAKQVLLCKGNMTFGGGTAMAWEISIATTIQSESSDA